MNANQPAVCMAAGTIGKVVIARLVPGTELLAGLRQVFDTQGIESGLILGGAASLVSASLRNVQTSPAEWPITDANRVFLDLPGPLELLSISGNGSRRPDGSLHLHAHVVVSTGTADGPGRCYGGHLVEGAVILSTGEVAVAALQGVRLARRQDPLTKTLELVPEACAPDSQPTEPQAPRR